MACPLLAAEVSTHEDSPCPSQWKQDDGRTRQLGIRNYLRSHIANLVVRGTESVHSSTLAQVSMVLPPRAMSDRGREALVNVSSASTEPARVDTDSLSSSRILGGQYSVTDLAGDESSALGQVIQPTGLALDARAAQPRKSLSHEVQPSLNNIRRGI